MSDAKTNVKLDREEVDAFNGIRGMAVECMNVQCGFRLRERFPHNVYLLEFTDTRAFVADRVNASGLPVHCIRYYHHQGDEQKEFDTRGGKNRLIKTGRIKKTFHLLAPKRGTKHILNPNPRPRVKPDGRDSHPRKGSLARFIRSHELEIAAPAPVI